MHSVFLCAIRVRAFLICLHIYYAAIGLIAPVRYADYNNIDK